MKPQNTKGRKKSEILILLLSALPFIDYVSGAAVFLAVAGAIVFDKSAIKTAASDRKSFALCAIISAFSMLSAIVAGNLIGAAVSVGIFCFLMILLYLKANMTAELFRRAETVISLGSAVAMLAALFQKYVIFPDGELYRPTAGAFNANYFGAIAVMVSLVALVHLFDDEKSGRSDTSKLWWMGVLAVNTVSLFISESRSSLLSFTACVIALLLLKKRYVYCGIAVAGGVAMWLTGWLSPSFFSWSNSLLYGFTERTVIWANAFRSFSQSPYTALIGRGPMSYYFVMEREGLFAANHAHNLLLDSLINVGIIGTALYALLAARIYGIVYRKRREGDGNGFMLSVLLTVQILTQGIADVTIVWHQCAVLAALIMTSRFKTKA